MRAKVGVDTVRSEKVQLHRPRLINTFYSSLTVPCVGSALARFRLETILLNVCAATHSLIQCCAQFLEK